MVKQRIRRKALPRLLALLLAAILFIPSLPGVVVYAAATDTEVMAELIVDENNIVTGVSNEGGLEACTKIVIPEGVVGIAPRAFSSAVNLKQVIFPDYSLREIGEFAFASCRELTSITIPGSVEKIGTGAFQFCDKLKNITVLHGIKKQDTDGNDTYVDMKAEAGVFADCRVLENVTIAPSVTSVSDDWFSDIIAASSIKVCVKDDVNFTDSKIEKKSLLSESSNPEALYTYSQNEDGSVTITKYMGPEPTTAVNVPVSINGKPVTDIAVADPEVEGSESAFPDDSKLNVPSDKLDDWVENNQDKYEFDEVPETLQRVTVKVTVPSMGGNPAVEVPDSSDTEGDVVIADVVTKMSPTPNRSFYYKKGEKPAISAIPQAAYRFTGWSLVCTSVNPGEDVSMGYIEDCKLPETLLTIPAPAEGEISSEFTLTASFTEDKVDEKNSLVVIPNIDNNGSIVASHTGDKGVITQSLTLSEKYSLKVGESEKELPLVQIGYIGPVSVETDEGTSQTLNLDGVAFRDRGLQNLVIPRGVGWIMPQAFDEAFGLQSITVNGMDGANVTGEVPFYYSNAGVLFRKTAEGTELVAYPRGKTDVNYTLPSDVASIGAHAFRGCSYLQEITFSSSLKNVGEQAFMDCVNLKRVNSWGQIETIGDNAFNGTALETVSLPETLKSIGNGAFANCKKLAKITIPNTVTSMGSQTFVNSGAESVSNKTSIEGYVGSTAYDYIHGTEGNVIDPDTDKSNLVFKPLIPDIPGEEVTKYQVVIENGSTEWLYAVNYSDGSSGKKIYASEGDIIDIHFEKLESPPVFMDFVKVTADTPVTQSGGIALFSSELANTYIAEQSIQSIIANSQKADLKLEEIRFRFAMPGANLLVMAGTRTKERDKDLPDNLQAKPSPPAASSAKDESGVPEITALSETGDNDTTENNTSTEDNAQAEEASNEQTEAPSAGADENKQESELPPEGEGEK